MFDVVGVETSGSSVGSPFMDSVSRDKFRLHLKKKKINHLSFKDVA